ncbi:MAG: hypothetical protein IBX63_12170 [Coriobacteriia bacterium]|nr:hypothetical protein [Coriobacteriia bacterium]
MPEHSRRHARRHERALPDDQLDTGSGRAFGLIARYAGCNFYFAVFDGADAAHLYKRFNGVTTLIKSASLTSVLGRTLEPDDVVALDAFGSSLTLTVNGVVVNSAATDTSITSACYGGFRCVAAQGGVVSFDDYSLHTASSVLAPQKTMTWEGADRLVGYGAPGPTS